MKTYKSMRGVTIDMGKLLSQQEKNITVGNTKSNARGDQLGRAGRVVKGADEIAREHYNKNNPRAVTQTTIKLDDAEVKKKIDAAKNSPDPLVDDWQEPATEKKVEAPKPKPKKQPAQAAKKETPTENKKDDDPWVEDAEGNFVRKSELKNESVSESKENRKND